jgi:hypothetical protein
MDYSSRLYFLKCAIFSLAGPSGKRAWLACVEIAIS